MEFRHYYRSGDLIRYYDFSAENKEHHKPRPALVLDYNKKNRSVYAVRITSKKKKTEDEEYELLADEVRVPKGLRYMEKDLYGVIKTNNIIEIDRRKISSTLDVFPYETKMNVLSVYERYKHSRWYRKYLEMNKVNHNVAMRCFKENLVAEKLGFFVDKNGELIYEFVKDRYVRLKEIQPLGRVGTVNVYSVKLGSGNLEFEGSLATRKSLKKILKDWDGAKKVSSWMREDVKYHMLMEKINHQLKPDPFPRSDKYRTFKNFKRVHLRKIEYAR